MLKKEQERSFILEQKAEAAREEEERLEFEYQQKMIR